MSAIYLRKTLGGFCPDDEDGVEAIKGIPLGEVIKAEWSRPRNYKFHKYFFAMLKLIVENTDGRFKSSKHLLQAVKIGVGSCDLITLKDGTEIWFPHSISFAKMGEDQFRDFFNKAVDWVILNVLPVEKHELERELFSMLGYDLSHLR